MSQLLDPLIANTIEDEFKPWQHQTILRMLMANGQYKNAALYIQVSIIIFFNGSKPGY